MKAGSRPYKKDNCSGKELKMCLAIPMQVKSIKGEFAEVQAGKFKRSINIQLLPMLKVKDYVIVHAGFAIERLDPEKAKETLRLVNEIH